MPELISRRLVLISRMLVALGFKFELLAWRLVGACFLVVTTFMLVFYPRDYVGPVS